MKRDLVLTRPLESSFLSCEKDTETILKKLFVLSKPYDTQLKRLLVIQEPDCLDNPQYENQVKNISLKNLIDNDYIKIIPKIKNQEFANFKTQILISFDNFVPNDKNPEFRDCMIHFDVLVPYEHWDLNNYRLRPLKILGYIDGILNRSKLSGIGTLQFVSAVELYPNEHIGGYSLIYAAIHGSDDYISEAK